jgi:hypothetical protein
MVCGNASLQIRVIVIQHSQYYRYIIIIIIETGQNNVLFDSEQKAKVKLYLRLSKYHVMRTYGGVEV